MTRLEEYIELGVFLLNFILFSQLILGSIGLYLYHKYLIHYLRDAMEESTESSSSETLVEEIIPSADVKITNNAFVPKGVLKKPANEKSVPKGVLKKRANEKSVPKGVLKKPANKKSVRKGVLKKPINEVPDNTISVVQPNVINPVDSKPESELFQTPQENDTKNESSEYNIEIEVDEKKEEILKAYFYQKIAAWHDNFNRKFSTLQNTKKKITKKLSSLVLSNKVPELDTHSVEILTEKNTSDETENTIMSAGQILAKNYYKNEPIEIAHLDQTNYETTSGTILNVRQVLLREPISRGISNVRDSNVLETKVHEPELIWPAVKPIYRDYILDID